MVSDKQKRLAGMFKTALTDKTVDAYVMAYHAGFVEACEKRGFDPEAVCKAAMQLDKFAQAPTGNVPGTVQAQHPRQPMIPTKNIRRAVNLPGPVTGAPRIPRIPGTPDTPGIPVNSTANTLGVVDQGPPSNVGQGAMGVGTRQPQYLPPGLNVP